MVQAIQNQYDAVDFAVVGFNVIEKLANDLKSNTAVATEEELIAMLYVDEDGDEVYGEMDDDEEEEAKKVLHTVPEALG